MKNAITLDAAHRPKLAREGKNLVVNIATGRHLTDAKGNRVEETLDLSPRRDSTTYNRLSHLMIDTQLKESFRDGHWMQLGSVDFYVTLGEDIDALSIYLSFVCEAGIVSSTFALQGDTLVSERPDVSRGMKFMRWADAEDVSTLRLGMTELMSRIQELGARAAGWRINDVMEQEASDSIRKISQIQRGNVIRIASYPMPVVVLSNGSNPLNGGKHNLVLDLVGHPTLMLEPDFEVEFVAERSDMEPERFFANSRF